MHEVTKELGTPERKVCNVPHDLPDASNLVFSSTETQLGPDTGELSMRFGINSGPVTAGLLRGDRSRFQLFG